MKENIGNTSTSPKETRSVFVGAKVTPSQRDHIKSLAKQCGMTVSDYILSCAYNFKPKARLTKEEAALLQNLLLIPIFSGICVVLPYAYVNMLLANYNRRISEELETALSIITTNYVSNDDIIYAVEQSIDYINPPVQQAFRKFLTQTKLINSNVKLAIEQLKGEINNEVFHEWCDSLILCQNDRSLKSTLTPIVNKLSDMRVVNAELENLVFGPRKEFITMAILVLINIPLVRFINKDWYHTLVATIPGQMVIAVCLAAVFVSFAFVVKLTQPIEYRR